MNSRQLVALIQQMDSLDKGRSLPRLPGPYGAFLMRYARERKDVVELALQHQVDVRHDGAISGRPLGSISIVPLSPSVAETLEETPWGKVGLCLGICPELMSPICLRLWLSAAAARDAFRKIVTSNNARLRILGDFRWLPPGVITAGTAEFAIDPLEPSQSWTHAPYLKTTADDISDIPHALDYLYMSIGGRGKLAHFRTLLTVRVGDGSFVVPGGVRAKALPFEATNLHLLKERLALCLAYKEPAESKWTIWASSAIDAGTGIDHNLRWASFARALGGVRGLDPEVINACAAALKAVGLEVPDVVPQVPDLPVLADPSLEAFSKAYLARLHLGTGASPLP